jgi:hypothetical protein
MMVDGSTFVLQPVASTESPLDVPGVSSRLRRGELVEVLRAERQRSGKAPVGALSRKRSQRVKTPLGTRTTADRK